jgi:hypothetical protein
MSFHIDLKTLNLDSDTSGRISAKIGSLVLAEIAHLDFGDVTTIIGRLGPGTRGIIAIRNLSKLGDLASHEAVKGL